MVVHSILLHALSEVGWALGTTFARDGDEIQVTWYRGAVRDQAQHFTIDALTTLAVCWLPELSTLVQFVLVVANSHIWAHRAATSFLEVR